MAFSVSWKGRFFALLLGLSLAFVAYLYIPLSSPVWYSLHLLLGLSTTALLSLAFFGRVSLVWRWTFQALGLLLGLFVLLWGVAEFWGSASLASYLRSWKEVAQDPFWMGVLLGFLLFGTEKKGEPRGGGVF